MTMPPRSWVWFSVGLGIGLSWCASALSQPSVPWDWIERGRTQAQTRQCRIQMMLRSAPLVSPDQQWEVYSRLELTASPSQDRLQSLLFARQRQTGRLILIYRSSDPSRLDLDFALLIPLAWQDQKLLSREFLGVFQSDIASDQAIVWSELSASDPLPSVQIWQLGKLGANYDMVQVLGWDPQTTGRALFQAGNFGSQPLVLSVSRDDYRAAQATQQVLTPLPPAGSGQLVASTDPAMTAKEWTNALPETIGSQCRP